MAEVFVGPVAQGYASGEVTVLLASPRSFLRRCRACYRDGQASA